MTRYADHGQGAADLVGDVRAPAVAREGGGARAQVHQERGGHAWVRVAIALTVLLVSAVTYTPRVPAPSSEPEVRRATRMLRAGERGAARRSVCHL